MINSERQPKYISHSLPGTVTKKPSRFVTKIERRSGQGYQLREAAQSSQNITVAAQSPYEEALRSKSRVSPLMWRNRKLTVHLAIPSLDFVNGNWFDRLITPLNHRQRNCASNVLHDLVEEARARRLEGPFLGSSTPQ